MTSLQSIKQRFGIIGRSEALDRALDTAVRVANTDLSVLITGESGVGKEAFSKVIHALSNRKHNNFIAVNCGAIPEGTINSELFGHEKGSFTGAATERKGYFETVNGGTIFLDEVGEMPLDTQAFLLRILESGEFIRVGASKTLTTDVRVVAATNVDLMERVKKGKFREDLYYRLNTVPIEVPSLRNRREDIYLLFRKFAIDFAEKYRTTPVQLDDKAKAALEHYSFPGNVRELRNIAEQISVLSENKLIGLEDLLTYIPNALKRNLPMIPEHDGKEGATMNEREILYKLLFDMKGDLNDLKNLVFELIRRNNLSVPDIRSMQQLQPSTLASNMPVPVQSQVFSNMPTKPNHEEATSSSDIEEETYYNSDSDGKPILIEHNTELYNDNLEDSLSLTDNEKNLIRKALRKYNGRRKDAADELGISERTLYRKIKEYDL
ncbi:MAG: sigma 54-interacting transcriptional regulator [Saprospiraceae bacterium]|nr:sigma 54-interacting transcriptional regulator [Saprospiraceae bacterium]